MRLLSTILPGLALLQCVTAVVAPLQEGELAVVAPREPVQHSERDEISHEQFLSPKKVLGKRRGGGGSGGRGGSGGGTSGTTGGGGGTVGGGGRTSPSSNLGGSTRAGSGPRPAYGGGRYYGGGSTVPYKPGSRSPSGITPFFFGAAALAFLPGLWLAGAYFYSYPRPHTYYNSTTQANETKPVTCACEENVVCGCDDNGDRTYLDELIGNGSYAALDNSVITVADLNGTQTLLINGSLPNGTTAPGGTDDESSSVGLRWLLENAGFWPVVATVCAMVLTM